MKAAPVVPESDDESEASELEEDKDSSEEEIDLESLMKKKNDKSLTHSQQKHNNYKLQSDSKILETKPAAAAPI